MKNFILALSVLCAANAALAGPGALEFVPNKNQWKGDFAYRMTTQGADVFLQQHGFTYLVHESGAYDKIDDYRHGAIKQAPELKFHAYRIVFANSLTPSFEEKQVQQHYYNYFLGNDPSRYAVNVHPALAIDYKNIYKGVDAHVSTENGNMKYDFIVRPGAKASDIVLRVEGADKLSIDNDGNLLIQTSVGTIAEHKPYVYQYAQDGTREVPCRYELKGNEVRFLFPKGYDQASELIIDPRVVFGTFTGSTADNWGFTATYDTLGNMYTGGIVSGLGFPVSTGAFQLVYNGGSTATGSRFPCDMGIMKMNADGTSIVYATYIGGSDNDQPHSMVVDKNNNLIIGGRTYSSDYPVSAFAVQTSNGGGADIVVTKLNDAGNVMVGSTYLGGSGDDCVNYNAEEFLGGNLKQNYGDDARSEVNVDAAGNIYMAAVTKSTNFPLRNAVQSSLRGTQDAVLVKLNPNLNNLLFSTYLGGSNDDAGYVLTLSADERDIYMAGGTISSDFPTTAGTYKPSAAGATDGYVVRISNGTPNYTLVRGTFIGTSGYDQVFGLARSAAGDVYITGQTLGGTFPVSPGVYSNPGSSQFVMKLNSDLTTSLLSTVFGTGSSSKTDISPVAFLVDVCENIYVSGWGGTLGGVNFPQMGAMTGMPITSGAFQSTTDGQDFYFIVLGPNASSLLYSSYFGRSSTNPLLGEHVDGGTSRFDKNGIIYQAMCGGCGGPATPGLPSTPGTISPKNKSGNCNLFALKIAFDLTKPDANIGLDKSNGCAPLIVNFTNSTVSAKTYDWDFGDGSAPFSGTTASHTFNKPGKYRVRMVATNPEACDAVGKTDTAWADVVVDTNSIDADFAYTVLDSCTSPFRVRFTNTSVYGKSGAADFTWNFGDGSGTYTGTTPPVHNYAKIGTYTVVLYMRDASSCNKVDSIKKTVTVVSRLIKAAASFPPSVCTSAPSVTLSFANGSENAKDILWDFGDGSFSTEKTPSHTYTKTGTFKVVLIVSNIGVCNQRDTFKQNVIITPGPKANFDFSPKIPKENDSIHYTNLSVNGLTYTWYFGDSTSSHVFNPSHLFRKTGTYNTCLVAEIPGGCNDTMCKNVEALIVPRIGVPTAFTPNGDNNNDVIYVRGAAIEKVDFRIFNRWGEEVFHSTSLEIGWDGMYKGKLQPMETYAYVVNATFINGETETLRGNISLLE